MDGFFSLRVPTPSLLVRTSGLAGASPFTSQEIPVPVPVDGATAGFLEGFYNKMPIKGRDRLGLFSPFSSGGWRCQQNDSNPKAGSR